LNSLHRLAEQFAQRPAAERSSLTPPEEVLIDDARAGMTPADMVEGKLVDLLRLTPLAIILRRTDVPRDRGRMQGSAPTLPRSL
jgi:hypothetical protein